MEDLKKILLAGIGSLAYTYEKSSNFIDELVTKGKLTIDEGKDLTQELKRNVKDTSSKFSDKVIPISKEDFKLIQEELDSLKNRVSELECKLSYTNSNETLE